MGVGEWIVVGISIVIGAWFLIGSYLNNRRSQAVLVWLVDGASELGKISAARFLASTGAGIRAMIKLENGPVAQIEVIMGLIRRENLPLWLFQLVTKKSDLLTLNFTLQKKPQHELWAFQVKKASALVEQANRGQKSALDFQEETLNHRLYTRQKSDENLSTLVKTYLEKHPQVLILAYQLKAPNLTIAEPIQAVMTVSAKEFFSSINQSLL